MMLQLATICWFNVFADDRPPTHTHTHPQPSHDALEGRHACAPVARCVRAHLHLQTAGWKEKEENWSRLTKESPIMHKKIQKCTITQATPAVRAVTWLCLCRSPSIREVARPPWSSVALMGENNLTKLVKAEEIRTFWFIYCNGEQASMERAE